MGVVKRLSEYLSFLSGLLRKVEVFFRNKKLCSKWNKCILPSGLLERKLER